MEVNVNIKFCTVTTLIRKNNSTSASKNLALKAPNITIKVQNFVFLPVLYISSL